MAPESGPLLCVRKGWWEGREKQLVGLWVSKGTWDGELVQEGNQVHVIPGGQLMKHLRKEAQLHTSNLLGTENEMLYLSTTETVGDLFKRTWARWRGWSTVETKVLIEKELWAVSRGGLQIGMKSLGCKRFGECPSLQETQGQNCKKRVCGRSIPCVRRYHAMIWLLATVYPIAHIGEIFLLWCSTLECLKCISGYFSLLLSS